MSGKAVQKRPDFRSHGKPAWAPDQGKMYRGEKQVLFEYRPGDGRGTFSRSSTATYRENQ